MCTVISFTYNGVYMSVLISQYITLPHPPGNCSLFSTSVTLFLF